MAMSTGANLQTGEQLHRVVLELIVNPSSRLVKDCIIRDTTDPITQRIAPGIVPDWRPSVLLRMFDSGQGMLSSCQGKSRAVFHANVEHLLYSCKCANIIPAVVVVKAHGYRCVPTRSTTG